MGVSAAELTVLARPALRRIKRRQFTKSHGPGAKNATVPKNSKPIFSRPLGLLKQARLTGIQRHPFGLGYANFFQQHGLRHVFIEPGVSAAELTVLAAPPLLAPQAQAQRNTTAPPQWRCGSAALIHSLQGYVARPTLPVRGWRRLPRFCRCRQAPWAQ